VFATTFSAPLKSSAARAAHRGQVGSPHRRSHICFGPISPVKPTGTVLFVPFNIKVGITVYQQPSAMHHCF
jgi:hypothetical protein